MVVVILIVGLGEVPKVHEVVVTVVPGIIHVVFQPALVSTLYSV